MKSRQNLTGKIYLSSKDILIKTTCNLFLVICIIFSMSIALFNALFFKAEVVGRSMQPTLNPIETNRDIVYASTFLGYSRGDIIIVELPNYAEDGIKRLIAVGGDELYFGNLNDDSEDKIYLNGKLLEEPYVARDNKSVVNQFKYVLKNGKTMDNLFWQGYTVKTENGKTSMVINKGFCLYLGDNRPESYDCSEFGPQRVNVIEAKVVVVVPYGYNLLTYLSSGFFRLFKKN